MKVSVLAELDQRLECLSGPSDNAFLLTIRGLVADWYYPFYTNMDYTLNKESYQSIISELYKINLTVLMSVCDMGMFISLLSIPSILSMISKISIITLYLYFLQYLYSFYFEWSDEVQAKQEPSRVTSI